MIDEDFKDISIDVKLFGMFVFDISFGCDFWEVNGNVVFVFVCFIIRDFVNWEKVIVFFGVIYIFDFGFGGVFGFGVLISCNKEGIGVCVILVGIVDGIIIEVGYKFEIFDRDEDNVVKYVIDWVCEFGFCFVKINIGKVFVDIKMSCLIGFLLIVVVGMIFVIVLWDFVLVIMNVGY